jgi:hypothetical protein
MKQDYLKYYELFSGNKISQFDPQAFTKEIGSYDLKDFLSKVGALSIMPENASHITRLEILTAATIANTYRPDTPKISNSHFIKILSQYLGTSSSITPLEDSTPNLFTESITFFDGSYIIFPGIFDSAGHMMRHLCRTMNSLRHSETNSRFLSVAVNEILAILLISDAIAHRATLSRGISGGTKTWEENIKIPNGPRLSKLQSAVTFRKEDLERILNDQNIPLSIINSYICVPGIEFPQGNDFENSLIYQKPIVNIKDIFYVPLAGQLIPALVHRILSLTIANKVTEDFSQTYQSSILDNIETSFRLLDSPRISGVCGFQSKKGSKWLEEGFRIDTDKIAYMQLFQDDIRDYKPEKPFAEWNNKEIPELIISRQRYITEQIFQKNHHINDIFWLVFLSGFNRMFSFQIDSKDLSCPTLVLPVADFEVIGFSEIGNSLSIWKYFNQKNIVRKSKEVACSSEIDEFEFYRSSHHSYPVPDDSKGIIAIKPGTGGDLRRKIYQKLDLHGVNAYRKLSTVEVISSYKSKAPLSFISPYSHTIDRAAVVVEAFSIPVWILGPQYSNQEEAKYHNIYNSLVDSISYWLWQMERFNRQFIDSLSNITSHLSIYIQLKHSNAWFEFPIDYKLPELNNTHLRDHLTIEINKEDNEIYIKFFESVRDFLVTPDNRFDRELMVIVLKAIKGLIIEHLGQPFVHISDEDIERTVESFIPQGKKKALLSLPIRDLRLDNKDIPELRLIQEADAIEVLKSLRSYLLSINNSNRTIRSRVKKVEVLNNAVGYLYNQLTSCISNICFSGLIEFLLAQHEAIVHHNQANRLSIPIQKDVYNDIPKLFDKLKEETQDLTLFSMAVRFLIEYAVAKPPSGFRPISMEVFDQIIALSAEIITLGSISDRINYEIDETSVAVQNGMLSVNQRSFYSASENFLPNYLNQLVQRSTARFEDSWGPFNPAEERLTTPESQDNEFTKAFQDEFGLTFDDFQIICGHLLVIGFDQPGPAKYCEIERAINSITTGTHLGQDIVRNTIDKFSLKARHEFLIPPTGFKKWEVYPWNSNRRLSFLQKPIIAVHCNNEKGIFWGNRHLINSVQFLENLCYTGKLKANSKSMNQYMGNVRNKEGAAFNDEVADAFSPYENIVTRKRIKKFCGKRISDSKGDLGDIDLLCACKTNHEMLVIECKNLNVAITPYEYHEELNNLYIDGEKDSEASKLLRRMKWLENNINLVIPELKLQDAKWVFRPMIITSDELLTPYLHKSLVPTYSLRKLSEELISHWISS